jgi:Tfp pilus assembly protein PilE
MSAYVYRKPVRRPRHAQLRRRLIITVLILVPFIAVAVYIYLGYHNTKQPSAVTSKVENTQITGQKHTFTNDYFKFEDTDTWVVKKDETNANRLTYIKFRKNQQLAEMIVYINQVPAPLNLEVPRVVPVRIVNDNSLLATAVSNPCLTAYAKGEPHKVKEVTIAQTTMLCDPDSPQYYMIFGEAGGDYQLNMKLSSGKRVQLIITYKDEGLDPQPDSPINIANSLRMR